MDNISQNQLYYSSNQGYGANGEKIKAAKESAVQKSNVGYVADKFDPMKHPDVLAKSAIYALLLSIGATQAANWLVRGNLKKMPDNISHSEALQRSPLFRIGKKFDSLVNETPTLKKISDNLGNFRKKIKNAKKPRIWNEIVSKVKEGTIAPWDKSLMYQEGKWAEAYGEFFEFLKKAPKEAFTDGKTKSYVESLIKKVDAGKINKVEAAKEIIEKGKLDGISAKHLDNIVLGKKRGFIDKIFGTTPNLNTSLAKAKFFNGKMKLGPVSKSLNKISMMIMEGTGGGVLGGKAALLMNVFGFLTAFNAVAKSTHAAKEKKKFESQQAQIQQSKTSAQTFGKGGHGAGVKPESTANVANNENPARNEKVASFMEDFMGFMLGSYLMTFPLGVAMNKVSGLANIGRDEKLVQGAAKRMGVEANNKIYQETVISYNKAIKHDKQARKYIKFLETGKLPLGQKILKAVGLSNENKFKSKIAGKMKEKMLITNITPNVTNAGMIEALKTKTKDKAWFKESRKIIKKAGKSKLTIRSVFKSNEFNKGKFGERLARYLVQKPLEISAKILSKGKFTLLNRNWTPKNSFGRFKKVGGGIGRIAFVGFVLTVPFRDAFMKLSHKIFGKPAFSQYDEMKGVYEKQHEEAEKRAQEKIDLTVADTQKQKPIQLPSQEQVKKQALINHFLHNHSKAQNTGLVNNKISNISQQVTPAVKANKTTETNEVRSLDTYTYIPSSD